MMNLFAILTLKASEMKIHADEFAISIDSDEAFKVNLHIKTCTVCPLFFEFSTSKHFWNVADVKFFICLLSL